MYNSNSSSKLLDNQKKDQRTEILRRLYGLDFNLIPMNGKKPCIEWKEYQNRRVTLDEIKEWLKGQFHSKDGERPWRPIGIKLSISPIDQHC